MNENTGPLLPEVVLLADVEYRKIPGYASAYAGTNGKIVFVKSNGTLLFPNEFEWKTTKGTYKYIKIVSDDFVQVTKAVHQLVCRTYHGPEPVDGKIYEPNHRNGNKHDNRPNNLEWSTRRQNIQHAYNAGLIQSGLRIELIDVVSNETKTYYSLSFLAREFNIPRHQMRDIVSRHRSIPYNGQFLFKVDDSVDKKITRHQRRDVICKDYISGEVSIYSSSQSASDATHVKVGSIVLRTSSRCPETTQNKLLSRYVFKPLTDNVTWPTFTREEAKASEDAYLKKHL